jgi:hypothetical protein
MANAVPKTEIVLRILAAADLLVANRWSERDGANASRRACGTERADSRLEWRAGKDHLILPAEPRFSEGQDEAGVRFPTGSLVDEAEDILVALLALCLSLSGRRVSQGTVSRLLSILKQGCQLD